MRSSTFWAQVLGGFSADVEVISFDEGAIANGSNDNAGLILRVAGDAAPVRISGYQLSQMASQSQWPPVRISEYVEGWVQVVTAGRRVVQAEAAL